MGYLGIPRGRRHARLRRGQPAVAHARVEAAERLLTTQSPQRRQVSPEFTLEIDGKQYSAREGQTILDVCRDAGIEVPTLCYEPKLPGFGACRMCVVEVEGARSLVASCATPAARGMVVRSESPQVIAARKMVLQLLLSSGNHNCAARGSDERDWTAFQLAVEEGDRSEKLCPTWGDCRLQDLAYHYQVTGEGHPGTEIHYPLEDVNPMIVRDFSRCILCGRCVQACNDIQVNKAISFGFRGAETKIIAAGDRPLKDSDCVFCGECVQVCPVGALVEKDVRYQIRPWETRQVRTTCSYCGVGCQINLHVLDNRVVKVSGVEGEAPNYGSLCVKGRFGYNFISSPDRLTQPLIKRNGEFQEASWDEALDDVAARIRKAMQEDRRDEIMYHVGRPGEDGFTERVMAAWGVDGHNSHTNICSSGARAGYELWCGIDRPSPDHARADVIWLVSSHLETGHYFNPHAQRIMEGKKRGAKLIVLDTRLSHTATHADFWLAPQPGSEAAIHLAIASYLIRNRLYNREFVRRWWNWEEYLDAVHPGLEPYDDRIQRGLPQHLPVVVHPLFDVFAGDPLEADEGRRSDRLQDALGRRSGAHHIRWSPLFSGSGVFGVPQHHEEQRLSSQSTRTTPGMS